MEPRKTLINKCRMTDEEAEKLFDGAPEGTTHYVNGSIAPFEMRNGADWYFWAEWNERWESIDTKGDDRIKSSHFPIYQRKP